jgi:hypothetical protein
MLQHSTSDATVSVPFKEPMCFKEPMWFHLPTKGQLAIQQVYRMTRARTTPHPLPQHPLPTKPEILSTLNIYQGT